MTQTEFDPAPADEGEVLAEVRNLRDANPIPAVPPSISGWIVDRVGKVEGNVAAVQEDISEMRPVTDDVKRWKLMGIGALAVTGIGAMALGVTFADVVKRVAGVILGR